jgi:hypothetical protein
VAERGLMGLRRGFPALWVLGAGWAPPALAVALDRTVAAELAGRGATGAELGGTLVGADVVTTGREPDGGWVDTGGLVGEERAD